MKDSLKMLLDYAGPGTWLLIVIALFITGDVIIKLFKYLAIMIRGYRD